MVFAIINYYIKEVQEMAKGKGASLKKGGTPKSEWIDISWPLHKGMRYWPQDEPPKIERILQRSKGDRTDLYGLTIISHTGTHIDAPLHFIPDGLTIDAMPIDAIMGPARVIESKDPVSVKAEELVPYSIQPGERILFKTQNSYKLYDTDKFIEDYVYVSPEAAHFLKDKKVSVVGLDYIALGSGTDKDKNVEAHQTLLGSGIWILEAINLSGVRPGPCELICLPLRLEHGDAAPARAIVRPL